MLDDVKKITIDKEDQRILYTTETDLPFTLEELREFLELTVPLGPICDLIGARSIEDYVLTHVPEKEFEDKVILTGTPMSHSLTISST